MTSLTLSNLQALAFDVVLFFFSRGAYTAAHGAGDGTMDTSAVSFLRFC